jgi:hypothetical protein
MAGFEVSTEGHGRRWSWDLAHGFRGSAPADRAKPAGARVTCSLGGAERDRLAPDPAVDRRVVVRGGDLDERGLRQRDEGGADVRQQLRTALGRLGDGGEDAAVDDVRGHGEADVEGGGAGVDVDDGGERRDCSDALTTVTLTPPNVTDVCNPSPTVTGSVISSSPPIPIVNGRVSLPPGTHTIRWTASDGIQTTTATQTLVVQPGILVQGQFLLDDRAKLQTVSGGAAGLGNAGIVTTKIGNDTSLGDILSVAPVVLLDRATVQGSIRSNGTITLGNSDSVDGSVVQLSSVSLPPVPDLTGVTFPSPSGGSPTFNPTNPPGGTVPLAPGSYGTVNINSGARVSLSAGTYYFQQLLINSASSTVVVPTTGIVRIFVASQLAYRGQVVTPAGQTAQILLGYNGTSSAVLEAPFLGTFIAPRGTVSIGTASAQLFRGRFFGQSLEVRPGIQVTCDTGVTAQ